MIRVAFFYLLRGMREIFSLFLGETARKISTVKYTGGRPEPIGFVGKKGGGKPGFPGSRKASGFPRARPFLLLHRLSLDLFPENDESQQPAAHHDKRSRLGDLVPVVPVALGVVGEGSKQIDIKI